MARELTKAELLQALLEMRERMLVKHGEDSEQINLVDETVANIVTGD